MIKLYICQSISQKFSFPIVAQNAWADTTFDTRNVAVHPLVIEVTDVQDTRPYFLRAPPVTRLPETAKEVRDYN